MAIETLSEQAGRPPAACGQWTRRRVISRDILGAWARLSPDRAEFSVSPGLLSVARFFGRLAGADDANNALTPTWRRFEGIGVNALRRSTGYPGVAASEAGLPPSWRVAAASIVHPCAFAPQLETERALAGPHYFSPPEDPTDFEQCSICRRRRAERTRPARPYRRWSAGRRMH